MQCGYAKQISTLINKSEYSNQFIFFSQFFVCLLQNKKVQDDSSKSNLGYDFYFYFRLSDFVRILKGQPLRYLLGAWGQFQACAHNSSWNKHKGSRDEKRGEERRREDFMSTSVYTLVSKFFSHKFPNYLKFPLLYKYTLIREEGGGARGDKGRVITSQKEVSCVITYFSLIS